MSLVFLRRRGLGKGSVTGMIECLRTEQVEACSLLHGRYGTQRSVHSERSCMLIRWGCTATIPEWITPTFVLNKSESIHRVNDKAGMRMLIKSTDPSCVPASITNMSSPLVTSAFPDMGMVLRPRYHSQGRNLWLVNGMDELLNVVREHPVVFRHGWYASEFIDKIAEYRVYVVNGRVATIAKKTPADPSAIAWNVAQGGRFDVLARGQWDMGVCRVAIEAFNLSGLDFSGVDVMVSRDGTPYVIELNSAPSLPHLSDGSVSYRQRIMSLYFKYVLENGTEVEPPDYHSGWRGVIHPGVTNE